MHAVGFFSLGRKLLMASLIPKLQEIPLYIAEKKPNYPMLEVSSGLSGIHISYASHLISTKAGILSILSKLGSCRRHALISLIGDGTSGSSSHVPFFTHTGRRLMTGGLIK